MPFAEFTFVGEFLGYLVSFSDLFVGVDVWAPFFEVACGIFKGGHFLRANGLGGGVKMSCGHRHYSSDGSWVEM